MKLHECPPNSRVKILTDVQVPPGALPIRIQEEINFHHIDGMYSFCTDDNHILLHPAAWTEVELVVPASQPPEEKVLDKEQEV